MMYKKKLLDNNVESEEVEPCLNYFIKLLRCCFYDAL